MQNSLVRKTVSVLNALIYLTVAATPFFYLKKGVYPYLLAKTFFFQGVVEVMFFLWLGLVILAPEYRPRFGKIWGAILIFLGALVLVSVLGEDPWRSFWSTQERVIGVVFFAHISAFAMIVTSLLGRLNWRRLFSVSLLASVGVSILAFMQLSVPNLLLVEHVGNRPGSTFGNPTFFAGYLLFNIFIAVYLLLDRLREKKRFDQSAFLWALAVFCDIAALFVTQTRGDILGLAAGVVVLLILFAVRPPEFGRQIFKDRRLYAGSAIFLVVFGLSFWFTRESEFWISVPGANRFRDISLESDGLQPRFIAIHSAWRGFLEKPVLGWGWENFNIVFNKYYDPRSLELNYQETRFDKPHNLYMEYLVTGGVVLVAAFVWLMFVLVRAFWRDKDPLLGALMLASLAAYLTRSAFVFDTIGPLLMLYLLIGVFEGRRVLALGSEAANARTGRMEAVSVPAGSSKKLFPHSARTKDKLIVGAVLVAGLSAAYYLNILGILATRHQYYGFKYFIANKPNEAIASFKKAINTPSPYAWALKRDYAAAMSEAYFYNPGVVPKDEARLAIKAMEEVALEHPKDAYNHYSLVDMYNQVSDIDPENFLVRAEREAKIALELSPDRQEVYFSLAKTKSLRNDYEEASRLLKYAMELNPKIPDAHFYYGLIAFASGDMDIGYNELKLSMELGRKWKNYNEPRVVANFFADSGHLEEAIELYKASLKMKEDLEARLKLGIVYYMQGDTVNARENISKVLSETDITKAPGYESFLPILRELGYSF